MLRWAVTQHAQRDATPCTRGPRRLTSRGSRLPADCCCTSACWMACPMRSAPGAGPFAVVTLINLMRLGMAVALMPVRLNLNASPAAAAVAPALAVPLARPEVAVALVPPRVARSRLRPAKTLASSLATACTKRARGARACGTSAGWGWVGSARPVHVPRRAPRWTNWRAGRWRCPEPPAGPWSPSALEVCRRRACCVHGCGAGEQRRATCRTLLTAV